MSSIVWPEVPKKLRAQRDPSEGEARGAREGKRPTHLAPPTSHQNGFVRPAKPSNAAA